MLWVPDQQRIRCTLRRIRDTKRLTPRCVTHRLDVVTIGIEHEGTVIVRVIVRPQPRRTIVAAAGRDRFRIKPVNHGAIGRRERDMRAGLWSCAAPDPEECLWCDAIAREAFAL